jgi:hypothetical protein
MVAMKPYEGLSETGGESNFQKASKPSHEQKGVKIYDEQKRISAVFTGDNQRLSASELRRCKHQ